MFYDTTRNCRNTRKMNTLIKVFVLTIFVSNCSRCLSQNGEELIFPEDFLFGASISAHQSEGAWNEGGKGVNVWDHFTHEHPDKIYQRHNADIACDSYHKIDEDIKMIKQLGLKSFRFSISWARILPTGLINSINQAGIDHYNKLINALLENGITPLVSIYHWDLPVTLQDLGGVTNSHFVDWFEDYAWVVFKHFGDRVKFWITFNEPFVICSVSFEEGTLAPGIVSKGVANYICTNNLLRAHAKVYHLYHKVFAHQKGQVGIALSMPWVIPVTDSLEDSEAVDRAIQFELGIFAHPIFIGDYPQVVKTRVAENSKLEGFRRSRLPNLSEEEINIIKGTADFFALNYYTGYLIGNNKTVSGVEPPSYKKDVAITLAQNESWPGEEGFKSVPWGLRNMLKYVRDNYGDVDIYVTENGFPDQTGDLEDDWRIEFHKEHLREVLNAIYLDGVNVKSYNIWSVMDNFEWNQGYRYKFGLYSVNFTDPNRRRTQKKSGRYYQAVIKNRKVDVEISAVQFSFNDYNPAINSCSLSYSLFYISIIYGTGYFFRKFNVL